MFFQFLFFIKKNYLCSMNIFTKSAVKSLLDSKVKCKEIVGWSLTSSKLIIHKSARSVHKIDISNLSGDELLKILYREIPNDVVGHFKVEVRNVKLRSII